MKNIKAHATYGASTSERWLNCPGSIKLSEKAPPQKESEYALEGTRAHEILEHLLSPAQVLKKLSPHHTKEMVEHAQTAVKYVSRVAKKISGTIVAEQKVDASPFTRPGEFGTLDVAIVALFDELHVIDYKYGAGVTVDPENNSQLIYYALAILFQHHWNFSKVHLTIIQPRAHHESGPIRTWSTTADHLAEWVPKFQDGVKKCESKNPLLNAGSWCKFCPAAVICPEISKKAMQDAAIDFADSGAAVPIVKKSVAIVKDMSVLLRSAERLKIWIDQLEKYAYEFLNSGGDIPGYKLVEKRATRKWVDETKVAKDAEKILGHKAYSMSLLSPAQMEKHIKDKSWIAKRVTSVSSGLTLVSDADSRPATTSAKKDFDVIELESNKSEPAQLCAGKQSRKSRKGGANGDDRKHQKERQNRREKMYDA